jgi:hypothetical protein
MRMIKALGLLPLLLAGACGRLTAQETGPFRMGAAVPVALDSLREYTHNACLGLCLDGAYQWRLPESATSFRAGAGLNLFPGSSSGGGKVSLTNLQFTGDVVVPVTGSRYAFVTGLSLNAWMKKASGTRDGYEYSASGTVRRPFTKMGFRAGFEASLDRHWAVSAMLQMTELGLDSEFVKGAPADYGEWNVLPSWVQVGVKYAF